MMKQSRQIPANSLTAAKSKHMAYKGSSQGELVAIYRLEFYKNQSKWKFCKNERNLKKETAKQKLNETYQVEDEEPEVEPLEPLNDAFLETDSDEIVQEVLTPRPPPPPRRWKTTLLDLRPQWPPGEPPACDGGWRGDEPCVEQVYSSELCVSNHQRNLPGWPAPDQHTDTLIEHLVSLAGPKQRPNLAETLREQIGQNVPMRHIGQAGQNYGRMGHKNVQMGQKTGQPMQDFVLVGQDMGQMGHFNQNMGEVNSHVGQYYGQQNTGNVEESIKPNFIPNVTYLDPKTDVLMQNIEYIEPDLKQGFGAKVVDFDRMEWEPERDCKLVHGGVEGGAGVCDWGAGGVRDACVAGAAAAVAEAEGWLGEDLKHFYLQPCSGEALSSPADVSLSSGDSASFVRGAHARPHSSEVDLTDYSCACACVSPRASAHLSLAALRRALHAHARATSLLLAELRARALAYAQPLPSPWRDDTRESLPTRDVPPVPPTPPATLVHPEQGRGRGRRLFTK